MPFLYEIEKELLKSASSKLKRKNEVMTCIAAFLANQSNWWEYRFDAKLFIFLKTWLKSLGSLRKIDQLSITFLFVCSPSAAANFSNRWEAAWLRLCQTLERSSWAPSVIPSACLCLSIHRSLFSIRCLKLAMELWRAFLVCFVYLLKAKSVRQDGADLMPELFFCTKVLCIWIISYLSLSPKDPKDLASF